MLFSVTQPSLLNFFFQWSFERRFYNTVNGKKQHLKVESWVQNHQTVLQVNIFRTQIAYSPFHYDNNNMEKVVTGCLLYTYILHTYKNSYFISNKCTKLLSNIIYGNFKRIKCYQKNQKMHTKHTATTSYMFFDMNFSIAE